MNLRQIETFLAIMTTGSFTSAAKLMHISQPGISRAARHLEIQLGVLLFERKQGRIHATADARALHQEIKRSYRGVKSIQDFASSLRTGAKSVLRVVASANVGLKLVPDAIACLVASDTDASFSLDVLRGPLMLDALLQEEADVGVSAVPLDHPLLESRAIGTWRLVCVFPANHPLRTKASFTSRDTLAYPLVAFTGDTPQGQIVDGWLEGGDPQRVVRVRSGLTACAMVVSGAGIAFADDLTARFFEAQGLAWRHVPHSPTFTSHAVWNANVPLPRAGRTLCDALQQRFREIDANPPRHERSHPC